MPPYCAVDISTPMLDHRMILYSIKKASPVKIARE